MMIQHIFVVEFAPKSHRHEWTPIDPLIAHLLRDSAEREAERWIERYPGTVCRVTCYTRGGEK